MRTAPNTISEPTQSPSTNIGRYTFMGDLNPFPGFRQPASLDEDFFRNATLSILTVTLSGNGVPAQIVRVQARHTGTLYDSAATLLAR